MPAQLDVITNTVLKNALKFTGKMGVLASEEEDEPVAMQNDLADTYKWEKEATQQCHRVPEQQHSSGPRT